MYPFLLLQPALTITPSKAQPDILPRPLPRGQPQPRSGTETVELSNTHSLQVLVFVSEKTQQIIRREEVRLAEACLTLQDYC